MSKSVIPQGKTKISLNVMDSLLKAVEEKAKLEGWSKSMVINEALKAYLKK